MMTAAPTPSVAAAAGTAIEVDYLPDGHIIISRLSKEADDAVAISDYFVAIADYETCGSGQSGCTRKPPANKL